MSFRLASKATQEQLEDYVLIYQPDEECVSVVSNASILSLSPGLVVSEKCEVRIGKKTCGCSSEGWSPQYHGGPPG